MDNEIGDVYKFGEFRLDAQKKVLWHQETLVSLPLKAVELLIVLAERRGEVVGKNELMESVWKDAYVEESNLSHNVYQLRKTLKSYDGEDYIQTVPRRGYRFSGTIFKESELSVETITLETEAEENRSETKIADTTTSIIGKNWRLVIAGMVSVIGLMLTASGYLIWKQRNIENSETIKSIAILPLKSFDETVENENLGLRITDALITRIGSFDQISVRPTISVINYKNSEANPLEVGKILAVDAVVKGRIQRENDKVRVTLQVLSVKSGEQIWARQFDGNADKLLSLQDEISSNLVKTLLTNSGSNQTSSLAEQPTENAEAYENYLKGRYHWNTRTAEGFEKAIGFFEQAIALDPKFAEAYSGLSDAHLGLYDYGIKKADETIPKAKTAVGRALQLKTNSSEAYSTLSAIQFLYDRENLAAEASIKKSIEYNPQNPAAHMRYGWYLTINGRFDDAAPNLENALRLDPISPIIQTNIGYLYACSGKLDEAERQFYKVLETNPNFSLPHWYLAAIYFRRGKKDEMYENYLKAFELDYGAELMAQIREVKKTSGEQAALTAWSEKLITNYAKTYSPPSNIALVFALQKNESKALDWLEEAEKQKDPWLLQIVHDPEYDFLRNNSRFLSILEKLKMKKAA